MNRREFLMGIGASLVPVVIKVSLPSIVYTRIPVEITPGMFKSVYTGGTGYLSKEAIDKWVKHLSEQLIKQTADIIERKLNEQTRFSDVNSSIFDTISYSSLATIRNT